MYSTERITSAKPSAPTSADPDIGGTDTKEERYYVGVLKNPEKNPDSVVAYIPLIVWTTFLSVIACISIQVIFKCWRGNQ